MYVFIIPVFIIYMYIMKLLSMIMSKYGPLEIGVALLYLDLWSPIR